MTNPETRDGSETAAPAPTPTTETVEAAGPADVRGPVGSSAFEWNRPTIVACLYLAAIIFGPLMLVGLVLAYIWKVEPAEAWELAHYRYLIHSFWMFCGAFVLIGAFALIFMLILDAHVLLPMMLFGLTLVPALLVWMLWRTIKALVTAQRRQPIY